MIMQASSIQYGVATGDTPQTLCQQVAHAINNGFQPHGGVSVTTVHNKQTGAEELLFAQAIIQISQIQIAGIRR